MKKALSELQKVTASINRLRRDFNKKEHELIMRERQLQEVQERGETKKQLMQDLKLLRSTKFTFESGAARRLWTNWVMPEFMPKNMKQLETVQDRLDEFAKYMKPINRI